MKQARNKAESRLANADGAVSKGYNAAQCASTPPFRLAFLVPAQGSHHGPRISMAFMYGWRAGAGYQPGEANFAAIQAWSAATVYQGAIALMGRQIDGGEGTSAER